MADLEEYPFTAKDIEALRQQLGGSFSTSPLIALALCVGTQAAEEVRLPYLREVEEDVRRQNRNLKEMERRIGQSEPTVPQGSWKKRVGGPLEETADVEMEMDTHVSSRPNTNQ